MAHQYNVRKREEDATDRTQGTTPLSGRCLQRI